MILPLEFYNKCDPSYKNVIDQLEMKLARINIYSYDLDEAKAGKIISTIFEFSRMYLIPKEYWEYCLEMTEKVVYGSERCIVSRAFLHMYYNDNYRLKPYGYEHLKLPWFSRVQDYCGDATERDLEYPHFYIEECFRDFELRTARLPSAKLVKRYKEMKALYPKIKAAQDGEEEWFKLLLESNDDVFVKDNVEICLGKYLLNVKLWKLYMDYLKQITNDVEEDNKESDIDLESFESLKEVFDFCENFSNIEMKERLPGKMKKVLPLDKKLCVAFYDTYQNQSFAFHEPIIRYILENANHQVLRKLFSSCKYFYFKNQTPICYRLQAYSREAYENESLFLRHSSNQDLFVKKMFITGIIKVFRTKRDDETFMANLISRLSHCHAKYIVLEAQNLTFIELEFLINHGGVVELNVIGCQIKDENNEYVHLEEITKFLPNIEKLQLSYVKTRVNTAKALLAQKFNAMI
uniref:Uncharacterized protein n=1 Tax=Panagrolaimus sp. PS1159 TaxID=55785 RepID=A0AC35F114_9BILA